MPVPSIILDGSMPYGTRIVTVNAVAYKINREMITPQWAEAESLNTTGGPDRKRWTKGRYKYTGEWQLASSSTAYPPPGQTFQATPPNESTPITFVITEVPFEADNQPTTIRVATVTAEQVINSITTVP